MTQNILFKIGKSAGGILVLLLAVSAVWAQPVPLPEVKLAPEDRILILAPHPDDEVLCCGGIIQRAASLHLPVRVVFLTYGDSNQWSFMLYRKHPVLMPGAVESMGMIRYQEAVAAARILGLSEINLTFLGYPDFGTLNMWYSRWNQRDPYRSLLTRRRAVPYKNAYRPGAPFNGKEILSDMKAIISDFKPTKIFVSHPEDHNGDHLAFYLFLRVTLWDLELQDKVELYPYLVHYKGWPKDRSLHPEEILNPPQVLATQNIWKTFSLTQKEIQLKEEALKAHRSQYQSSTKYLTSFIRANELFGDFSVIKLKSGEKLNVSTQPLGGQDAGDVPDELTADEKVAFIGLEWRSVRLEKEKLVISIELSKPLAKDVGASVYIFGYRSDVPFDRMPKIHIKLGVSDYSIYDQMKILSSEEIEVSREAKEITLKVPLKVLGDPRRILTSARTYLGSVPLDYISWRVLEIQ